MEHHWVLGKVPAPSLTACLLGASAPRLQPALPLAPHTCRKGGAWIFFPERLGMVLSPKDRGLCQSGPSAFVLRLCAELSDTR